MKHEHENQTTGTLHLDLASIRRRLDERRERFVRLRAQQRRERDQLLDSEPLDTSDHAKQDEGVDLLDQLEASEQRELMAIDAAMARIEDGSYGICARCGEPIAPRRLEVIPETTMCVSCAELAAGSPQASQASQAPQERARRERGGSKL